jgi:serine/threonine protein kinase
MNRISLYNSIKDNSIPKFKEFENELFPCINVLDNIVLKKAKRNEYENYKFFSDKVLENVCENFSLIYNCENKDEDYFFAMEKFDGDFLSFEKNLTEGSFDELISCYLQILMALYTIDYYGKFHGDLNPGNILFKKVENTESEYIKYEIGDKKYYVKHFNRLWVVSDFEYMGEKGAELNFDSMFFKKLFGDLYYKIDESIKPIKGNWLYDMYVLAHFTGAHKMADRIFDMFCSNCSLNPVQSIPLIIKNDISELFKVI